MKGEREKNMEDEWGREMMGDEESRRETENDLCDFSCLPDISCLTRTQTQVSTENQSKRGLMYCINQMLFIV